MIASELLDARQDAYTARGRIPKFAMLGYNLDIDTIPTKGVSPQYRNPSEDY